MSVNPRAVRLTVSTAATLLWPLLKHYRPRLALALCLVPVSAVMAMLVPYLTKLAIDDAIVPATAAKALGAHGATLTLLITVAMGAVVGGYLSDALYVSILQRTGQTMIADLRARVYRRTLRLPRSYFDTHPIGTLLTRVTSDIEALGESLATGVLSLFLDAVKVTGYLTMMFVLNWRLTLLLLVLLPVLALLIRFFNNRIRATFLGARQALSEATGYLQECLSGMKTLQLFAAERQAIGTFEAKNRRFFDAQNTSNLYDALMFSLVEGITTLALALMLWYAAGELLLGAITLGLLVAFMEYIQRLFVPVREFSQQIAIIQRALAALDHIAELVRTPLDPADPVLDLGITVQPVAAGPDGTPARFETLDFRDVRFRYQPGGPEIVKGVSFSLRRGETLAIVGATGSGKSTLIKLLTRAYGGYEGSILLNGRELREIHADTLGRLVSVVHQGVFLYQGSVAFNIGLGRAGLDEEAIENAAKYVSADEFVNRLEGGYQFRIAAGGANLSAGQCQLISFARAVAAQTELIVLDEATSSVDSLTERLIQQAVGRLYQDKTVIAIAHRLSTIRNAHTILVMDAGRVVESGDHAGLIAKGGLYADLVGQLENAQPEQAIQPAGRQTGAA
jgi:ATP-binding cassette subfamily B protein